MAVHSLKRSRAKVKTRRIKELLDPDLLWDRPADWPRLPEVLASESKFVGLYKVENHDMNHVVLNFNCAGTTYTVDWGDGTVDSAVTSGANASHTYDYSDVDLGPATSEGFKCAVVTATPNSGAINFSAIGLNNKHSAYGTNTGLSSGWLDLRMSLPGISNIANFVIGNGSSILHRNVRQFEYVGVCAVNNGTNMFAGYVGLESFKVPRSFTSSMTNLSSFLNGCGRLRYIPELDTALCTSFSLAFGGCTQLRSAPKLDTSAATVLSNMYQNCSSLEYVPDMTTGAVTAVTSMFSGCSALKNAPAISNTGSCASWNNMFLNCISLRSVPTYNMTLGTTASGMFQGCSVLEVIPALNFAAIASTGGFTNIFTSTPSLRKILATGARFGHTIPSQLGSADLDVYYTNLGTASGAQTLVVSGNAVATDTPSIATAKGWTVTGS